MTTVTFAFLTLFTWMVSSGTRLRPEQCTVYGQNEGTEGFSSNVPYKKAVIHDKTKLTLTCERSPEMSVALERIFTWDRIKKTCALHLCVNLLQKVKDNVKGEKQNMRVCQCRFQQLLVYFVSENNCLLLTTEIKTDNHSKHLNYRSICPSMAHCAHINTFLVVDHWKRMHCICICKGCNFEVKIPCGFLYTERGPAFPEFLIFILSDSQVSLMSSVESKKAYVRICYVQVLSRFSAPLCPKEALLTQADGDKFIVYTSSMEKVQHTFTSRWAARFFLAAALLLGIYVTRVKISPNRLHPAHGSDFTMAMFFTMTWHCFSPSVITYQPSEWPRIAARISLAVCLSCALGRSVHVLIACRTAHTVMKLFCTTHQQFRILTVTVLFIMVTLSPSFPNKNVRHWFEDIFGDNTVGSTLRSWAVFRQIELLATLYCVFVSLPSLRQSILTNLNFFSVLLNVQLITCQQNSRVPTKYVLVIKIYRRI